MTTVRIMKGDLRLERVERVPDGAKVVQAGPAVELSRRLGGGEGRNGNRVAVWKLDAGRLHKVGDDFYLEVFGHQPQLASNEYGACTVGRGVWAVSFRKPPARRG